jgi:luciferase family oxidoreductase group 1
MKIGFLDFGSVLESHTNTIGHTIEFAKLIDDLGFSRYWLAEHHEGEVAWRSPEIMMSILAGYTENIRIGSAGVLLPLNSSLRLAQHFKMLATLFPDRIDMGVAKGISTINICKELLNDVSLEYTLKEHENRVKKLCWFLTTEITDTGTDKIEIVPLSGQKPEMWYLTTNCGNMDTVIENEMSLSLSLIHYSTVAIEKRIENLLELSDKYYAINKQPLVYNISVSMILSEDKKVVQKIKDGNSNKHMLLGVGGGIDECLEYIYKIKLQTNTNEIIIKPIYSSFDQKNNMAKLLATEFNI